MDVTTIALGVTIILAQLGVCMAASRCTKITTPCFQLERTLPPDDATHDSQTTTTKTQATQSTQTPQQHQ
jgi:hypothetical protein